MGLRLIRLGLEPLKDLAAKVSEKPHAVHYVVINTNPIYLAPILTRIKSLSNVRPILMTGLILPLDKSNPYYATVKKVIRVVFAILGLAVLVTAAAAISLIAHKINRYVGGVLLVLGLIVLGCGAGFPPTRHMVINALKGNNVVEGVYRDGIANATQNVFRQAKASSIPILDLITTFNGRQNVITNGAPNAAGSELIAQGILDIVTDERQAEGKVYSKKPEHQRFTGRSKSWVFHMAELCQSLKLVMKD